MRGVIKLFVLVTKLFLRFKVGICSVFSQELLLRALRVFRELLPVLIIFREFVRLRKHVLIIVGNEEPASMENAYVLAPKL